MADLIAITIGDIKGVGIKILIDAWINRKINNFILFTDHKIIKQYLNNKNIKIELNIIKKEKIYIDNKKLNIFSYNSNSKEDNTYKSLKFAYNFCKEKICIGIITLPIRKDLIKNKINKNFIGHTEYFQKIDIF